MRSLRYDRRRNSGNSTCYGCAWLLRVVGELGGDAGVALGGGAGGVDDVADAAVVAEADGDHVVEADGRALWGFDGAREEDVGLGEDAVDAEAPGFVAR